MPEDNEPYFPEIAEVGEIAEAIIQVVVKSNSVPANDLYYGLRKPVERLMEKSIGGDDRFAEIIRNPLVCPREMKHRFPSTFKPRSLGNQNQSAGLFFTKQNMCS